MEKFLSVSVLFALKGSSLAIVGSSSAPSMLIFNFEDFFDSTFCKNKNAIYHPAVTSRCCFLVSFVLGIQKWVE